MEFTKNGIDALRIRDSVDVCAFLKKFPPEVRLKIYECLLVNDILGTADSVTQSSGFGARLQYDLSPQVLRLCHQIHDEALPVLYAKKNTYIACFRVINDPYPTPWYYSDDEEDDEGGTVSVDGPQVELCPLTRYENGLTTVPFPITNLCNYSNVRKVQNWRVVVSRLSDPGGQWNPIWSLDEFCQSICVKPPAYLEVLLIPCGLDKSHTGFYRSNRFDDIFKPLRMLRNLRRLDIEDAYASDVPDIIELASDNEREGLFKVHDKDGELEIPADLIEELQTLTTSQQPVDLLHMMHEALTAYAQAFERYPSYKMQLGLRREDIIDLDDRDLDHKKYLRTGAFNPFHAPTFHPLEYALSMAKDAAVSGEAEIFKEYRRNALRYLEPQWARIEEANHEMTEFVKREKVSDGLFDVFAREKEWRSPSASSDRFNVEKTDKLQVPLVYLYTNRI
ncbi:hypothetical protein SBOR_8836 [Sclerotinia borealis F-4128]|uniref:F-box domain-containing protein n=1 Tax=Sclerotinia borealis (strain F-4128) TaxID=1432307 RepID=W9C872_SCLBF|nr:hypothetical protein SBOR_8836 [Sclerotinia borealis F-4128]